MSRSAPAPTPRRVLAITSLALSLALAGPLFADAAADRIRATPGGGHSEWDAKVKLIMLANYDLDGSGWLDKVPEIQSVPCSTWGALDEGVRAGWGTGIRQIYGFAEGYAWVGSAIGFSEALRTQADSALATCESRAFSDGGGVFVGSVADQIRGRPEQGGGSEWDAAVKPILLGAYDYNRSGWLDTTDELMAMPCEVFAALDEGVKEKWTYGLRQIYGFKSELSWVGYAIGFSETIRSGADVRIATCLESGTQAQQAPMQAPASGPTHQRIRAVPGGGSGSWDAEVGRILVGAYDGNLSGWLDTADEVRAITCDDWRAMDDGVKAGWGYGIRTIYGFAEGYQWVGSAILIAESMRTVGDSRIVQCVGDGGSSTSSTPAAADPAQLIASFPGGGTSEWDDAVKQVIVAFYDANGSGLVNNKAEIGKIPCSVWGAMDAGVKQRFSYGLRPIYGFEDGYSWIGNVVGFDESVRKLGDKALVGCGYSE